MRLDAFRIRNLGPFRDFAVDLSEYEGQTLLAVTGANGAGKTTALELALAGSMYRQTPTRGTLQDLATARDAMLEARVVNGSAWTLRHLVDKVSGKSEAVVLDAEGRSVLDSPKVREFDAWATRNLPTQEVLFSSVFGAQGSAGFLGMKPSERKGVLLRALGLERLELLAAGARERAREAESKAQSVRQRLAEGRAQANVHEADAAVLAAEEAADRATADAEAAALELERARLEAADYTLAHQRWQESQKQRAALVARAASLTTTRDDLIRRLANNRAILGEADAIRAAVQKTEAQTAQLAELEAELASQRSQRAVWEQRVGEATRTEAAAADRLRRCDAQLAGSAKVLELAALLPERTERAADRQGELAQAELALRELQSASLVGAEGRIAELRGTLSIIAKGTVDADGVAREALERDDEAVRAAAERPGLLAAAQADVIAAKGRLEAARLEVAEAERAASRVDHIRLVEAELESATLALAEAEAEREAQARKEPDPGGVLKLERQCVFARETLATLQPLARKATPLASAEARVAELEPQLLATEHDLADTERQLALLPETSAPSGGPELDELERRARSLATQSADATGALGAARARLAAALESHKRADALASDLAVLEAELADWTRLASDLGKDGLQAAEIDAAGPELTALVNDLLHTCVGPRWTVSIETTRLSADGKRQLEGCDVRVIDTERGRDAEASTYSGGERVMLGEAVSLALSMLGCRRSGLEGVTLVRDESGAALDPANARAYVAMLRRAAQLIGAKHVLFVSHSPEVIEMADARIEVRP